MDLELLKQLGAAFLFLTQVTPNKPLGQIGPLFLRPSVWLMHLASALGQTLFLHFYQNDSNASTREYSK